MNTLSNEFTSGPGDYNLNQPKNTISYPWAPTTTIQSMGGSVMDQNFMDVDSELKNITRPLTNNPQKKYIPGQEGKEQKMIHFDDGFCSYSDIVVPFLREQQIPSTIFLVNSVLDGEIPIRNKLAFCLNNEARSDFLSAWQKIIDNEDEADVDFSRMENSDILSWAKQAITKELEEVITIFYKKYIRENHHSHPFLHRKAVLELKQEPYVEFGSHTLNHLMLSQLNPEEQQYEIIEGHKYLEQFLEMELFHLKNNLFK